MITLHSALAKCLDLNKDELTIETCPLGPFRDMVDVLRVRMVASGEVIDLEIYAYEPGEPIKITNIEEVVYQDWPPDGC